MARLRCNVESPYDEHIGQGQKFPSPRPLSRWRWYAPTRLLSCNEGGAAAKFESPRPGSLHNFQKIEQILQFDTRLSSGLKQAKSTRILNIYSVYGHIALIT